MARVRRSLSVTYGGEVVAELTAPRPWQLRCRYTDAALDRWPGNTPLLSCALPVSSRPLDATIFCAGLLPEGQHLAALAARAGVATNDTYALLARYGRDVAGALVIAANDEPARVPSVVPYADADLADEVAQLHDHPLGVHDDSELSIAGLQDKLLLVALADGGWGRPVHGRASTHIMKLDDRLRPGLVAAEAACLALAASIGLTACAPSLVDLAGISCLIVERFDRRVVGQAGSGVGAVERVHQEDACQATGRDPRLDRGRGKYERAGGPALRDVATLLDRYALDAAQELERLVRVVTFTVCIGNADAHGKNLAFVHEPPGQIRLAPLYDTVPTVLWPALRTDAAMAVHGRTAIGAIGLDDVVAEAASWSMSPAAARSAAIATASQLADAAGAGQVGGLDVPRALAASIAARVPAFLASS